MSSVISTSTAAQYLSAAPTGTRPDTVTAAAFAGWPVAAQSALVRNFGSGSPAAILVGQAGQQLIATLNETGTDVDVVPAPTDLDTAPASLTRQAFEAWPGAAQVFYVRANGSGDPRSVDLGGTAPGGSTATLNEAYGLANGVTLTDRGAPTAAEDALIQKTVDQLTPADFFTLSPDDQYAYFVKNATPAFKASDPAASVLKFGTQAVSTIVTLTSNGRPFGVALPTNTYPGFDTALTGSKVAQASTVKAGVFANWPREIQRAYVEGKFTAATDPDTTDAYRTESYPKVVVFADGGKLASIAAPGAAVELADLPAGFGNGTTGLKAATFLSWSPAAQIAFARGVYESNGTSSFQLPDAAGLQTLTVALSPTRDGLALTSSDGRAARLAIDPASLDLDLFGLWPSADQAAYLDAKGGGTPKSLLVGGGTFLLGLGPGALPRLESVPAGFTTNPAGLAPATFLGWSPTVRAAYLNQPNFAGVTETTVQDSSGTSVQQRSATIGTAPGPVLTATRTPAGGVVTTGSILAIDPTPGMGLPNPTANIFGGAGGLDPNPNASSADQLFRPLDGTDGGTIADKPDKVAAQFAKAPGVLTPAEFGTWHSAIQLEYLRKYGDASRGYALEIGPGTGGVAKSTAFISEAGDQVYTVGTLQKTDIGKMSPKDQAVLTTLSAFTDPKTGRAGELDLTTNKAAVVAKLDQLAKDIGQDFTPLKGGASNMPYSDRQIFLDEIAILQDKLAQSSIISVSSINPQIDELQARFERANAFATAIPGKGLLTEPTKIAYGNGTAFDDRTASVSIVTISSGGARSETLTLAEFVKRYAGRVDPATTDTSLTKTISPSVTVTFLGSDGNPLKDKADNTKSLASVSISKITVQIGDRTAPTLDVDKNVGLRQSYTTLMQQETQLLSLARSRQALAQTGRLEGGTQHLDVPNLVYLFQLQANLTGEAKLRADTEELNQINALVKLYGAAQNLVNRVLKDNSSTNKDSIGPDDSGKTPEELAAGAFFGSTAKHPIELIYGNIAHTTDALGKRTYENWTKLGTQLSERVALINQESQIKMNAINSSTKAKDRNFDLANNALTKMNEIVQKIAGAM